MLFRSEGVNPFAELRRAIDFFADLSEVEANGHRSGRSVCWRTPSASGYPRYYLQKFHFQSDGYLSGASAERYDHQVEVLFGGGAAAMRRQALVPLKAALPGARLPGVMRRACSMSDAARDGSCARSRRITHGFA